MAGGDPTRPGGNQGGEKGGNIRAGGWTEGPGAKTGPIVVFATISKEGGGGGGTNARPGGGGKKKKKKNTLQLLTDDEGAPSLLSKPGIGLAGGPIRGGRRGSERPRSRELHGPGLCKRFLVAIGSYGPALEDPWREKRFQNQRITFLIGCGAQGGAPPGGGRLFSVGGNRVGFGRKKPVDFFFGQFRGPTSPPAGGRHFKGQYGGKKGVGRASVFHARGGGARRFVFRAHFDWWGLRKNSSVWETWGNSMSGEVAPPGHIPGYTGGR